MPKNNNKKRLTIRTMKVKRKVKTARKKLIKRSKKTEAGLKRVLFPNKKRRR